MYNPFAVITPELMNSILKQPKLFVRQHYPRGSDHSDNDKTTGLLLTYYYKEDHIEVNRAHFHMQQLADDQYRFLYDSEKEEHRERLIQAASQPAGYKIYLNLLPKTWKPSVLLRRKIHGYMQHNLPWWDYNTNNKLHIHLKDRYGKLYLLLGWKGNKADVLLENIEKY